MNQHGVATVESQMGWMDFIASLVDSLAWPIAAIVITLLFRRQIRGLFESIKRLTWGDKAVDFANKLDKLENASREVVPDEQALEQAPQYDARFDRLLEIAPAAAILDAWAPVEATLRNMGIRRGYERDILKSPLQTMQKLRNDGVISKPVYEMIRQLRSIRNSAAHQREVSPTDALRFRELSEKVNRALGVTSVGA